MNIKSIGKLLADRERRSQRLFFIKTFSRRELLGKDLYHSSPCIIPTNSETLRRLLAQQLGLILPSILLLSWLSLVTHAGPSKQTSLSRRQPLGV